MGIEVCDVHRQTQGHYCWGKTKLAILAQHCLYATLNMGQVEMGVHGKILGLAQFPSHCTTLEGNISTWI